MSNHIVCEDNGTVSTSYTPHNPHLVEMRRNGGMRDDEFPRECMDMFNPAPLEKSIEWEGLYRKFH